MSGQPEEEGTFPNSLESPRGIPMPIAGKSIRQALKDLGSSPCFGTRAQSDRVSQLAKEEPFKSRVTTKGFIAAITEHADEEGEPDIDENRPGDFIEQCLNRLFAAAIGPRLIHVRLPAAAWILKVPLVEVERYLEQMERVGIATYLGEGWWELTINERLELVSL